MPYNEPVTGFKERNPMAKTEQPQPEETVQQHSAKRNMSATVASTVVTVVLGVAANILIGKVSARVHDQIAPNPESE